MDREHDDPLIGVPAHLDAEQVRAWLDIVNASHDDILSRSDSVFMELTARSLAQWRGGDRSIAWLRLLYRLLGKMLMPMRARRRLIFGEWRDG